MSYEEKPKPKLSLKEHILTTTQTIEVRGNDNELLEWVEVTRKCYHNNVEALLEYKIRPTEEGKKYNVYQNINHILTEK